MFNVNNKETRTMQFGGANVFRGTEKLYWFDMGQTKIKIVRKKLCFNEILHFLTFVLNHSKNKPHKISWKFWVQLKVNCLDLFLTL